MSVSQSEITILHVHESNSPGSWYLDTTIFDPFPDCVESRFQLPYMLRSPYLCSTWAQEVKTRCGRITQIMCLTDQLLYQRYWRTTLRYLAPLPPKMTLGKYSIKLMQFDECYKYCFINMFTVNFKMTYKTKVEIVICTYWQALLFKM